MFAFQLNPQTVENRLNTLQKVGSFIKTGSVQNPTGYLACTGAEISRTTYAALFAVIGTTYGSGDGSTTFNLPNFNPVCEIRKSGTFVCRGNGKSLGIYQGGAGLGLIKYTANSSIFQQTNAFDKNAGTTVTYTGTDGTNLAAIGVINSAKSGLVADLTTLQSQTSYIFIKY